MESHVDSKSSDSEEEPLVPQEINEEFLQTLAATIPEITRVLRQKGTSENADNVQRLLICLNRCKSEFRAEQIRTEELLEEIRQFEKRLNSAAQISKLDQEAITQLRAVIESAWKQRDAALNREEIAQNAAKRMTEKQQTLEKDVQQFSDKSLIPRNSTDEKKEKLQIDKEIINLSERIYLQSSYTTELEAVTRTLEEKNKAFIKFQEEASIERDTNRKRIRQLQTDLSNMKAKELTYTKQHNEIKTINADLAKDQVQQNLQTLTLKNHLKNLNSQYNTMTNKLAKLTIDLQYAVKERNKNKSELRQKIDLLKRRENKMVKLKQEISKLVKIRENTNRKQGLLEEIKWAADEDNTRLKTQLIMQDKEVECLRRLAHQLERKNQNLVKERDELKHDSLKEKRMTKKSLEEFQKAQHEIRSLQDCLRQMELKQQKFETQSNELQKSREKKQEELQTLSENIDTLQYEIHLKENNELQLKRTISDIHEKCAMLQTKYDSILSERNMLQRSLQVMEEEKRILNETITRYQDEIEKLKKSTLSQNGVIGKLQIQLDRLEKDRRTMKGELYSAKLAHHHIRATLAEKKNENDQFTKSLQDYEHNLGFLRKELDIIRDEKNVIFSKLTKRNNDYTQLKGGFESLRVANNKMLKELSQCHDEINLLSIQIKNLRTIYAILRKDRENAADLRHELLQAHRTLNQERIKARALLEEMMTPMNIHRWRTLGGTDPERMDLIKRIQLLRKQILNQNVFALKQERALEESRRLYDALKKFMVQLPSNKVKEELNETRNLLSRKDKKLKAVLAELHTTDLEDKSKESKLEKFKSELVVTKTQLTLVKEQKRKLLEERRFLLQIRTQCFSAPPTMQKP